MQGLHPRTQQKSRRLKEEPHMHRQRKHRTYGVSAVCRKSAGIEKHMVIVRRIQSLVVSQRNILRKEYAGKKEGMSVFDPVFVLSAILDWAGTAHNERGYLELTADYRTRAEGR